MWTYNSTYNKWSLSDDKISKSDFDYLKQELSATRFYSKCLSGATYLPINGTEDVYDILGSYKSRNWYISTDSTFGSQYSVTTVPSQHASPIDSNTSFDYYTKYLSEYGLTLKNLFTPNRLIKDSLNNYNYVDVATTDILDLSLTYTNLTIDGVRVKEGHKILVKDQISSVTLDFTQDPNVYFSGNFTVIQDLGATVEYEYYNEENGIYDYKNGSLIRSNELEDYKKCIRFSVVTKLGDLNKEKQYHLSRLLDGYYPTTALDQPIEFKEKHNWILRNRVDYNNLFEINYYDIIKHGTQSYNIDGVTYSIPERTISVGEFGVILNTQEGKSNIIVNKYKVNLRSVDETSIYYWICGDDNTLLKVRKHDFYIERIITEDIPSLQPLVVKTNLHSVSFFNDLKGVAVGELNTILYTNNGGHEWKRIELDDFNSFNYNKVIYTTNTNFYIAGNVGVLIEMVESISGWSAFKRRVSRKIDDDDEYLLVDNINDLYRANISTWGLSYSYSTQSISTNKELLFLACNNNIIAAYDINNSFSEIGTDFIYFDFGFDYGDIKNITRKDNTNSFYFTGTDVFTSQDGIFSFNINDFSYLGTGSSYSNTSVSSTPATFEYAVYPNEIFDYNGQELMICGNTSLIQAATYSTTLIFNSLDSTFEDKLKSKLLVLDYDIAGKLNFFTDAGDYRLPNSLTFSSSLLSVTGSFIGFRPIEHPAESTNNGTYSETNWITYWRDREKTFEFYSSNPLSDYSKVLISTTFSLTNISPSFSVTGANITGSDSQMLSLAPNITTENSSRFIGGLTAISTPSLPYNIYLYDYLMVARVSTTYPVSVGDVIKLDSSVVNGEFVVNKIKTLSGRNFIYMFTNFNENIIKDLQSTTASVTLTNLNKYLTADDLVYKFNQHPISYGYNLDYVNSYGQITSSSSTIQLSAKFNSETAYYNLQTSFSLASVNPVITTISNYKFEGGVSASTPIPDSTYYFEGGITSNPSSIFAGKGPAGYNPSEDGNPAIDALLDYPMGLDFDMSGNLYFTEFNNNIIRSVDTGGIISTFGGIQSLLPAYSGDAGPVIIAELFEPTDIAFDMFGNAYVATLSASGSAPYNVIRKIDVGGTIDIFAGTLGVSGGYSGNGVPATTCRLNSPQAVAVDKVNNILYICDTFNNKVRRVHLATNIIKDFAGNGGTGFGGDGGLATGARLNKPTGIAVDSFFNVYIADSGNNRIRKVDFGSGRISTIAGSNAVGYSGDGGLALSSRLNNPTGVAVDLSGNIYIADSNNFAIRLIKPNGIISTLTLDVNPNRIVKVAITPTQDIVYSVDPVSVGGGYVYYHDKPEVPATVTGQLTYIPIDGDTITLELNGSSYVYTFRTIPSLPYEVQISGTIDGCLSNFISSILEPITSSNFGGGYVTIGAPDGYGSIPNSSPIWTLGLHTDFIIPEVLAVLTGFLGFLPLDGDTSVLKLNGVTDTYTFKNTPTLPNHIQIVGTINGCLSNLILGITSSVFYSTYLSSAGITTATTNGITLVAQSGFGSIPNSSPSWALDLTSTTGGVFSETVNDMIYTSGFLKFGYSPTYNLLDYLTSINNIGEVNPPFYASKEYLAMPEYRNIPFGSLTSSTVYIDTNGMTYSGGAMSMTGNKILFGTDLKLEWDSIFLNTFVDVNIHGSSLYTTNKLLVLNKYYDYDNSAYVIEFHKRLNFTLGDAGILSGGTLDIISRRHLYQISEDLQELNNIQRSGNKITETYTGFTFSNYENELNFKIPTDSYAKILLSDAETVQMISSIIYIDDKNELALNITRLAREYIVPISNTSNFSGKLYISCSEKHDLSTGDSAVFEFNGGSQSSQVLNQQYFGYHVITKITDYDFVTDIDYGNSVLVGNDIGYAKYVKQDPFFNYQPVDIIDFGVNKKGKMSVELSIENIKLSGTTYSLINVDYEKYRFRLVDGLNIETLSVTYPWILEAEISGAVIGSLGGDLIWYKGTWECGRWFGGTWQSGVWMSGDWYGGTWNSNKVNDKILSVQVDTKTKDIEQSLWYDGRWYAGTWNNGTWNNGRWYGGTWNGGTWYKGIWNDGTWNNGLFEGGIWVLGTWNGGVFNTDSEPAYWLDGKWLGGDFENGMWYNGTWQQKNSLSRFGTKAFNSRTATWHGGKWLSGSFYSKLDTNDNGELDVSEVHKYSIWKTGTWLSGEWYGGIAYNMDFRTGTWYGGILEDIQVIGIDTTTNVNTFTLNGIFKFNLGDIIYMIDNQLNNTNSVFGKNSTPGKYTILDTIEDSVNKTTTIYVATGLSSIGTSVSSPTNTGLRVVSKFKNLNWKSGIWTNGLFEDGLWEGGIWYNGVFDATWS